MNKFNELLGRARKFNERDTKALVGYLRNYKVDYINDPEVSKALNNAELSLDYINQAWESIEELRIICKVLESYRFASTKEQILGFFENSRNKKMHSLVAERVEYFLYYAEEHLRVSHVKYEKRTKLTLNERGFFVPAE